MHKSELVMSSRTDGDTIVYRLSQFVGPSRWRVDLMAALEKAGHRVEQQDIPGLWRIDGGPELTTGQLMQVGAQLLRQPPTS